MRLVTTLSAICWLAASARGEVATSESYLAKIKPLLAEKCVACHGPLRSEAGLRLDAAVLIQRGSQEHAVVSKENPETSPLIQRVATHDIQQRMPPEGEGVALNGEEIELLRRWIAAGLPAPENESYVASPREHWAYQPLVAPTLPADGSAEDINPVDRLLSQLQRDHRLERVPPTDRHTWLKRVTLDLTGLPATPEEIEQFVHNSAPDARERVVDRLLARPTHGQRWGRHWMDVWRYSDWDGYKEELRGSQRHIWHWRDWIIESINADKPYDTMIVEMLAGDEIAPTDPDTLRATGFLARNFHRSNRNIWLDATVEHTAKAFMGLTIACARCHAHKYDPISQEDYYRFRAIFEPHEVRTEQLPGQPDVARAGIPRVFDAKPDAKTFLLIRGNEKQPREDAPLQAGVPLGLDMPFDPQAIPLPAVAYQPELSPVAEANALNAAWDRLEKAQQAAEKRLKELRSASQTANSPDTATATAHTSDKPSAGQEADEPMHPIAAAMLEVHVAEANLISLQARYAADHAKADAAPPERVQQLSEAAARAEQHANQLATESAFRRSLNDLAQAKAKDYPDAKKKSAAIQQAEKNLKDNREARDKAIAAAKEKPTTYSSVGKIHPQQSTGRRLALARWIIDPRNPLTPRVAINHIWLRHFGAPLVDEVFDFGLRAKPPAAQTVLDWLAGELMQRQWDMKPVHRLLTLSHTYGLDSSIAAGDHQLAQTRDPENRYWWHAQVRRLDAEEIRDSLLAASAALDQTFGGPDLSQDSGENIHRRSLYFRHAYEKQVPLLVLFDGASPSECYRRSPSILPQQALALSNSSLARQLSRQLGQRLFEQARARHPDNRPAAENDFIEQLFLATLGRPPSPAEVQTCRSFLASPQASDQLAQSQSLAHALFNHNDFVVAR